MLERCGIKVITYCGPISPATLRSALNRNLGRQRLPPPPSEIITKLIVQKCGFKINNDLLYLSKEPVEAPRLTDPEGIFLDMVLSEGPIVTSEAVHHRLMEVGFSKGSVTGVLKSSPIIQKISTSYYTVLGTKYDLTDIQKARDKLLYSIP